MKVKERTEQLLAKENETVASLPKNGGEGGGREIGMGKNLVYENANCNPK